MNYYKNDIRHVKGDTFSSAIVIEGLGQAVDSIYFTCRENLNDNADILFQCGINNGISLIEYDEENDIRKYAVRIAPSKTRNLQSGTYYYDLEVSVNSDVFTVMKGKFILEQDSTREDNAENTIILKVDEINGEVIGADIDEKLDYLEDTKLLIKTSLNTFGLGITDDETFRSYANLISQIHNKYKNYEEINLLPFPTNNFPVTSTAGNLTATINNDGTIQVTGEKSTTGWENINFQFGETIYLHAGTYASMFTLSATGTESGTFRNLSGLFTITEQYRFTGGYFTTNATGTINQKTFPILLSFDDLFEMKGDE